jgi:hypothetical protein
MNYRERVLTVLRGGVADRVPWFADLDYWVFSMEKRGERPPGFRQSPEYLELHRELDIGFYLQGYWPFRTLCDGSIEIEEGWEDNIRYRRIHTPVGDLEEQWKYLAVSFSESPYVHLVKDVADLRTIRYWHEHTYYEPNYGRAVWLGDNVGDLGVVLCYVPRSPLMQMVVEYAGLMTTVDLWINAHEELTETLAVIEEAHNRAAELSLASPAECLMIPENLSAEMIGRRLFDEYMREYETRWNERIRQAGKFSFVHMDGTLRGLIGAVASTGFRVIEAFTPAPVGNVDVREIRQMVEPQTILWGGLPGAFLSPVMSEEDFETHVRFVLDVMTTHPGFVLGVADQVPPDALYHRVKRVSKLVEERLMNI